MSGLLEKLFAGRWIAGPEIEDALKEAKRLNSLGITAIINYLGEDYRSRDVVDDAAKTYLALVREIRRRRLRADISAKITELGDLIDKKLTRENYSKIVNFAAKNNVFVWLDMEEHRFVGDTIRLYRSMMKKGNTGICIQSYLRRSGVDLKSLPASATVRLVKGAYNGPRLIAFPSRKETTDNYLTLMDYMFRRFRRFTIASHDTMVLNRAMALNRKRRKEVTYAMLKGIRNDYAASLARKGERVSVYVPFGKLWIPYSYRRLKEMSNLKLILRSVFGG